MSATEMPSGRGRLPGMGATAAAPAAAEPTSPGDTPAPAPRRRSAKPSQRPDGRRGSATKPPPAVRHDPSPAAAGAGPQPEETPVRGPYAGETKMQVNPRIYASTWRHYEDLVDDLPRPQRRGALTALVNAILAQHAPADADAALEAITWLRQAETRQAP